MSLSLSLSLSLSVPGGGVLAGVPAAVLAEEAKAAADAAAAPKKEKKKTAQEKADEKARLEQQAEDNAQVGVAPLLLALPVARLSCRTRPGCRVYRRDTFINALVSKYCLIWRLTRRGTLLLSAQAFDASMGLFGCSFWGLKKKENSGACEPGK